MEMIVYPEELMAKRIKELEAENELLREALRDVIECDPGSYEATIARKALGDTND